jgi:hypothetical protein
MNRLLKSSIVFGLGIACSAVAYADTDLSGTWVISQPVTAFKTIDGKLPPLRPEALATYNARIAASKKGNRSWDPVSKCKPPGEPRTFVQDSWPFELMQSPGRVDFLFQWNRLDRAVTVNTPEETYQGPTYFGQSTAKWDGDTLVISSMGFKENTSLDPAGLPRTEDMKLTERFRLINGGKNLEARIHVEDPATYTQAWDMALVFKRMPAGTRITEDVCFERLKLNDFATMDNSLKKVGSQ